jgi:hypothetical protein
MMTTILDQKTLKNDKASIEQKLHIEHDVTARDSTDDATILDRMTLH